MGKINILQPNVFNMLAAGEVVENPASVVKELIENSLDAGATAIDVLVEQGGIRKIQVSDDGIGIQREDMRTAFVPHATSKIHDIEDLDALATLGFRGEALASIASVSEVTLISASKAQRQASKIVLKGGEVVFEGEDSRAVGTIITVENIFYNTPARLKFLKKATSELRCVLDVVRTETLANPSIAFTLSNEDGVILSHDGGRLIDAICSVYGVDTADKLLEISFEDKTSQVKVAGFVSALDFTKPNRTYQTTIVNGRAVDDATVRTAVEKAYGDYLMKRAYPAFILDIVMPFDALDVNVHPRKSEVRFLDKHAVFSAVYHAVQNAINASLAKSALGFNVNVEESDYYNRDDVFSDARAGEREGVQTKIDTSSLYSYKTAPRDFGFFGKSDGFKESAIGVSNPYIYQSENDFTPFDESFSSIPPYEQSSGVFDGKVLGQIFATYLLVERDEKLYVIDQHAAHERILYDKIADACKPEFSQPLLVPYKLSLTGAEEEYIEKIMPTLKSLGFDIEHDGFVYLVKAVPSAVANVNFNKFFGELFSNMLSENELTLAQLLKDKLCQQACKAAIKGGEVLSREQIEQVIKNYVDDSGNLPAKCPHGRPAVIALSKRDFEKAFKRIV